MAKNDLVLLDGILDDYVARGITPADSGEAFEYFATEQILKDYALSKEQLLSGSVDGRNDGGIDEFFILVKGIWLRIFSKGIGLDPTHRSTCTLSLVNMTILLSKRQ